MVVVVVVVPPWCVLHSAWWCTLGAWCAYGAWCTTHGGVVVGGGGGGGGGGGPLVVVVYGSSHTPTQHTLTHPHTQHTAHTAHILGWGGGGEHKIFAKSEEPHSHTEREHTIFAKSKGRGQSTGRGGGESPLFGAGMQVGLKVTCSIYEGARCAHGAWCVVRPGCGGA